MLRPGKQLMALAAIALAIVSSRPAHAALVLVSSRSALGGNDLLDWHTFPGGIGSTFIEEDMTSLGGLPLTVKYFAPTPITGSIGESAGAAGDFPAGSAYVDGLGSSGGTFFAGRRTLELTFDQPIRGFGADIDASFNSFAAGFINRVIIEAFNDPSHQVVGSQSVQISNPASNGQPFFIGGLSDQANITRVVFSVVSFNIATGNFGAANGKVNEVSLVSPFSGSPVAVPEPATLSMFLFGIGSVAVAGLRRRSRAC